MNFTSSRPRSVGDLRNEEVAVLRGHSNPSLIYSFWNLIVCSPLRVMKSGKKRENGHLSENERVRKQYHSSMNELMSSYPATPSPLRKVPNYITYSRVSNRRTPPLIRFLIFFAHGHFYSNPPDY